MKISDMVQSELDYIKQNANFTERESRLVDLKNAEYTIEEIAEIMNVSTSTASRIWKKVRIKIIKLNEISKNSHGGG